jgi:hypothetical protein
LHTLKDRWGIHTSCTWMLKSRATGFYQLHGLDPQAAHPVVNQAPLHRTTSSGGAGSRGRARATAAASTVPSDQTWAVDTMIIVPPERSGTPS